MVEIGYKSQTYSQKVGEVASIDIRRIRQLISAIALPSTTPDEEMYDKTLIETLKEPEGLLLSISSVERKRHGMNCLHAA
jgi:hypothetical protein